MIDINKYILLPLDQVENELKNLGFDVELVDNNFNVVGDKKLVTNVVISKDLARIYYGEFILIWRAKMTVENFGVKHIGFILDGNGRWAKKRGKERLYGHKMGVEAVRRTIDACLKYEIKYVSLFCFSTENWKRDKYEVDGIFKLLENFIDEHTQDCINKGVRVSFLGDRDKFDDLLREKWQNLNM